MYEVAIIGSGPAGLAATMYCIRKGMDTQLIRGHLGGKSSLTVTFPGGTEHRVFKAREQVQVFRSRIDYLTHTWRDDRASEIQEHRDGFEIHLTKGGAIAAERVIVATGVHSTPLGVPGESEFMGRALGSSAISYTHALRDRTAVIIGDSDRAIEAALESSLQTSRVYLLLEEKSKYSHRHLEMARANEGITVYGGCRILRFEGDEFARSVTFQGSANDAKSGEPGEHTLEAEAFFVERDPRPRSEIVANLVELTPAGAIRINQCNETSNKRIFAAGDVTDVGVEQILVALGEGARAGLSAYRHLTMQV
ncbi:MAG: NAD(P)/FAD-dependent oxidoreductase [Spirochaetaceae bacterium]|nr:MAG: NAD(P)/FAD-dependent oxidoreductase [Spirochaetaceae bacterium]